MVDYNQISREVIEQIKEAKGLENASPSDNMQDLGFDSLDSIDLTMKLEEKYNIKIPNSDTEKMFPTQISSEVSSQHQPYASVKALVDYVHSKVNEAAQLPSRH